MLLDDTHHQFGWPPRKQVVNPTGTGAKVYAEFAERKIRAALQRKFPELRVNTGVLTADPNSESTEAPIAVVCEFPTAASAAAMDEAHLLAWNFSRTALLITLEPHRLIAWSCCQHPNTDIHNRQICELVDADGTGGESSQQRAVRDLLHWVSLISGNFLRQHAVKFPADGRADALLLKNLRVIRQQLLDLNLPSNYCHDLLARVIFTQFLFHRTDTDGKPFFDAQLLKQRCDGALVGNHSEFKTILANKEETYSLFRWLDNKFNGDLFPGKEDQTAEERERAWQEEKDAVSPHHLRLLADLVSGQLDLMDQQLLLWPRYRFDTIPLEFISSVYEEFLNEEKHEAKAYYTPGHLVDFILDTALPWNSEAWNLRILDPCCGSGIFLVKAFQRLIYRWRLAHPGQDPMVSDLKPILANNLMGIDRNPEAVRVACFSLYLAMADAIDPKHYLKRDRVFPHIRGTQLIARDFFDEETQGICSVDHAGTFDLVIGNAPWGDKSIKQTSDVSVTIEVLPTPAKKKKPKPIPTKAEAWATKYGWPVANFDIGPLFLAKGIKLMTSNGQMAMIQPASTLLYLRSGRAKALRQKLFGEFRVLEVTNFSALRRELFPKVVGPACLVVLSARASQPEDTLFYFCPKPLRDELKRDRFVIEPQDINQLTSSEAANDEFIWTALALGGRRDLNLLRRLIRFPSLEQMEEAGLVSTREGVISGDRGREVPDLKNRPFLSSRRFPEETFLELDSSKLPLWVDPRVDSRASSDFSAFRNPQLLIKQGWTTRDRRFRAALVVPIAEAQSAEVICSQSYLSIHDTDPNGKHLKAACLAYNSRLAAYFMAVTSSRIGHYRTESTANELLRVPLPPISDEQLKGISSFHDIDARIQELFKLREADWTLIDDMLDISLVDATSMAGGPGRRTTSRKTQRSDESTTLSAYVRSFARVLKSTFGADKSICATIFDDLPKNRLPVRMVALHLDWPGREAITTERMDADGLLTKLNELYAESLQGKGLATGGRGFGFQRVAFLLQWHQESHGKVHSLYIIKPDQCRYWTRSLAMRDADQLSTAILKASTRKRARQ